MKLGLLLSGNLGLKTLEQLWGSREIIFVLTDSSSEAIKDFCLLNHIPLFIGNPRKGKCAEFISDKQIDILISVNYLFLIESDLISLPSKVAFNIHGSLLPKYRGRTPHVWAIINNEKETGITAHIIDQNCDTGRILEQIKIPILAHETGADILQKFAYKYPELVNSVIQMIENDNYQGKVQDESKATYFGKRTPEDGQINWDWQRERIYNWIRAQAPPYPGAFSFYHGKRVIFIKSKLSTLGFQDSQENGTILLLNPLAVKTPNGALELVMLEDNRDFEYRKGEVLQ